MPYSVGRSGVYKAVHGCWVGAGGWKRVVSRWVGVGGVWKLKYTAGTLAVPTASIRGYATSPDYSFARVTFLPDGKVGAMFSVHTVASQPEDLAPWFDPLDPTIGARYEIRASRLSGTDMLDGNPLNVWLPLSELRYWQLTTQPTVLNRTLAVALQFDIRPVGGTDPIATGTITLSATTFDGTGGGPGRVGGIDINPPPRHLAF